MKFLSMTLVMLVSLILRSNAQDAAVEKIILPEALTAGNQLLDPKDPWTIRITIGRRLESQDASFGFSGRDLNAKQVLAALSDLRKLETRARSKFKVIVSADQRAFSDDLLLLLETCAQPSSSIDKIWLQVASLDQPGAGPERLLPIFLPTDRIGDGAAAEAAEPKSFIAELEPATRNRITNDLPRGASIQYRFEDKDESWESFTTKVGKLKSDGLDSAIKLTVSPLLLLGDFVSVIDWLRATGYQSGGSDDARVQICLSRRREIVVQDRQVLRIEAQAFQLAPPEEESPTPEEEFTSDAPPADGDLSLGSHFADGEYGGRRGGRKHARRGRGAKAQLAVDRGLEWLAKHQSPDGRWDSDDFMKNADPALGPLSDGRGQANFDVASTGLALLAFLGAGETHRAGVYKKTVAMGLKWLRDQQDQDGCFGSRQVASFTYNHAIGALAMAEAYGLTKSPLFKSYAERGIAFVQSCQNPYKAWRYGEADGQNDTSVTGWMVLALKSGQAAGIEIDQNRFQWALSWIEDMTDQENGRTGSLRSGEPPVRESERVADFPAAFSEAPTAIAILTRIFCGQDPSQSEMIKKGTALLLAHPPLWTKRPERSTWTTGPSEPWPSSRWAARPGRPGTKRCWRTSSRSSEPTATSPAPGIRRAPGAMPAAASTRQP